MDDDLVPTTNQATAERVDAILEALADHDDARRERELAHHLSPTFTLIRPDLVAEGLMAFGEAFSLIGHGAGSTVRLVRTSAVEEHHDHFRYTWSRTEAGRAVESGCDFGWTSPDGRLQQIVTFVGKLPPAP